MKSKYNSFCVLCSQRIRIGDEITKNEDRGKWVHHVCPDKQGKFVSSVNLAALIEKTDWQDTWALLYNPSH